MKELSDMHHLNWCQARIWLLTLSLTSGHLESYCIVLYQEYSHLMEIHLVKSGKKLKMMSLIFQNLFFQNFQIPALP